MDVHSPKQRSYNMSRIRAENTRPEIMVRRWLWANGYRFQLHRKDLPGKPDIVLPKYKAVIFVHGCFWHRHSCDAAATPATNVEFWRRKFDENTARDQRYIDALQVTGWRIAVVWECTLKGQASVTDTVAEDIRSWLISDSSARNIGITDRNRHQ